LRRTRDALAATGVSVDLLYPFTMAGRTDPAAFAPALEAGATLGAPLANVLCYDRDPVRRTERLIELADLAATYGIALAIEFYPPSQVKTLSEALAEIDKTGRSDVGVTLDLNHPAIAIAQLADGPASIDPAQIEWEAGIQRLLPGQGAFPISAFLNALNPNTLLSIEIPQQNAIDKGLSPLERARNAVKAARGFTRQTGEQDA
jgi:sugar phosphate isomerase/epimerase